MEELLQKLMAGIGRMRSDGVSGGFDQAPAQGLGQFDGRTRQFTSQDEALDRQQQVLGEDPQIAALRQQREQLGQLGQSGPGFGQMPDENPNRLQQALASFLGIRG